MKSTTLRESTIINFLFQYSFTEGAEGTSSQILHEKRQRFLESILGNLTFLTSHFSFLFFLFHLEFKNNGFLKVNYVNQKIKLRRKIMTPHTENL